MIISTTKSEKGIINDNNYDYFGEWTDVTLSYCEMWITNLLECECPVTTVISQTSVLLPLEGLFIVLCIWTCVTFCKIFCYPDSLSVYMNFAGDKELSLEIILLLQGRLFFKGYSSHDSTVHNHVCVG